MRRVIVVTLFVFCGTAFSEGEWQEGFYTWGHEVNVIAFCYGKGAHWVIAESSVLETLKKEHAKITTRPYESIYVKVKGRPLERELDGFAENYDGYFEVLEAKEFAKRRAQCK